MIFLSEIEGSRN